MTCTICNSAIFGQYLIQGERGIAVCSSCATRHASCAFCNVSWPDATPLADGRMICGRCHSVGVNDTEAFAELYREVRAWTQTFLEHRLLPIPVAKLVDLDWIRSKTVSHVGTATQPGVCEVTFTGDQCTSCTIGVAAHYDRVTTSHYLAHELGHAHLYQRTRDPNVTFEVSEGFACWLQEQWLLAHTPDSARTKWYQSLPLNYRNAFESFKASMNKFGMFRATCSKIHKKDLGKRHIHTRTTTNKGEKNMEHETAALIEYDHGTLAESVEFARNPEPRCPCVLLLDTSSSMAGAPIAELQAGLQIFKDEVMEDSLASRRLEVAIVTFNSQVDVVQSFATIDTMVVPELTTSGLTKMSEAVKMALGLIDGRKSIYKREGVSYYRPWCVLITDGEPMGEEPGAFEAASKELQMALETKKLTHFAIGVNSANMDKLQELSGQTPAKLKGLNFGLFFKWLSASATTASTSQLGTEASVKLGPVNPWGEIHVG